MYRKNSPLRFLLFIGCIMAFLCLTTCEKSKTGKLERENLFTIEYGNFENQLDMFHLESVYLRPDSQLYMNEGIFYISNSNAGKIMQMTSFGDLLALCYNAEKNPRPTFIDTEQTEKIMTRHAVVYPLNHPTFLTADSKKHIFAVDTLNEDRIEYDQTENLALRDIVLHFNEIGTFIDIIGQEGVGGSPFPPVEGMYSSADDSITVVCRTENSFRVYWYDSDGNLLYKVPIAFNSLPSPYDEKGNIFSSIDKIVPDFLEKKLYIKIDYFRENIDSETNVSAGISYDKSCLYIFNIEAKRYEKRIDLAAYEGTEIIGTETKHFKKVYSLIGITANNWCFLSTPIHDGYILELIDLNTNKIYTRHLSVSTDELMYNTFHLSPEGILSALLAGNDKAVITWWRTNEITGAGKNEE